MGDEAKTGTPSAADVKAMFTVLLDGAKRDLLAQVKDSIYQVYANFESVDDTVVESEVVQTQTEVTILSHSQRNSVSKRKRSNPLQLM